jgi:hypothetical protein
MKNWNPGATMGVCLFLGQAVSLKVLAELHNNDLIVDGWHLVLSTAVLLAGWQTVQHAYGRGLQDAKRGDDSLSSVSPDGE